MLLPSTWRGWWRVEEITCSLTRHLGFHLVFPSSHENIHERTTGLKWWLALTHLINSPPTPIFYEKNMCACEIRGSAHLARISKNSCKLEYIGGARLRKEPISPWFMTQKGWDSRPENEEGPQSKIQPIPPSPDLELEGLGARTNNLGVSVSGTDTEAAWSIQSPFYLEWVPRLRKAGQQHKLAQHRGSGSALGNTALEHCPATLAEGIDFRCSSEVPTLYLSPSSPTRQMEILSLSSRN